MSAFEIVVVGSELVPAPVSGATACARWRLHSAATITEAMARCADPSLLRLVLIIGEPDSAAGLLDNLPAFRAAHPGIPVLIGAAPGHLALRRLPMFARAGLDGVVLFDRSGLQLRTDLEHMLITQLSDYHVRRALGGIPARLWPCYAWILRAARLDNTVERCCARLGHSESTLRERARLSNVMSPGKWLGFARCLHVAHQVDTTSLSLTQISKRLGFSSLAAMSGLIHRRTGRTASAMRELGGLACVLDAMSPRR